MQHTGKCLVVWRVVLFSFSSLVSFPTSRRLIWDMFDQHIVGFGLGCPWSCIQKHTENTLDRWDVVKEILYCMKQPLIQRKMHSTHGWWANWIFYDQPEVIAEVAPLPKGNCSLARPRSIVPPLAISSFLRCIYIVNHMVFGTLAAIKEPWNHLSAASDPLRKDIAPYVDWAPHTRPSCRQPPAAAVGPHDCQGVDIHVHRDPKSQPGKGRWGDILGGPDGKILHFIFAS